MSELLAPFAIVVVLLLCAILAVLLFTRLNTWRQADAVWPYYARKPLASPEQVLYQRLVAALPGHTVMFQVPVTAVLGVKRGFDAGAWNRRICRLHYDFVVCAKDATVLAAIELDGHATREGDDARCAWMKARASAAAGVRLVRWQAKALPAPAAIREILAEPAESLAHGVVCSANQSWWPPMPGAAGNAPLA